MQFLKFSLILISLNSFAFLGTDCFESNYDVSVTHKSFPFGLLQKTIDVTKKGCELSITHNQWKYHNRKWIVDICRDPIHIKSEVGSVDVMRKVGQCTTSKNSFCKEYLKLKRIVEDDGLIFAAGLKSELDTDHGKMYCSYLLINEYLNKSVVFNKGQNYDYLVKTTAIKKEADNSLVIDPNAGNADF